MVTNVFYASIRLIARPSKQGGPDGSGWGNGSQTSSAAASGGFE